MTRNRTLWLYCVAFTLLTANLPAQTFHHLIGGPFDDRPSCISKTEDGGWIISGDESYQPFV